MKLEHRKENGVWIVTPQGRLDAQSVADFKKQIASLLTEENPRIFLDLRNVEFVDSTGLGALISVLRKVESKEGNLRLSHLTPEVESIFEITRLHKIFKILPETPPKR